MSASWLMTFIFCSGEVANAATFRACMILGAEMLSAEMAIAEDILQLRTESWLHPSISRVHTIRLVVVVVIVVIVVVFTRA